MLRVAGLRSIIRFELLLLRNRVFRHLSSWRDWLTVVFCLCVFGIFAFGWFTQATSERLNIVVSIVSAFVSFNAIQAVVDRLHYHQSDGPIAQHSLGIVPNVLILGFFALSIIGFVIALVMLVDAVLFALVFGLATGVALVVSSRLAKIIARTLKISGGFYSFSSVIPNGMVISLRYLFGFSCLLAFIYVTITSNGQVGAAVLVAPGIAVAVLVHLGNGPGPTLKFRAEMGHGPREILLDAARPIAVFSAALLLTAILVEGLEIAVSLLALFCLVLAFTIVRALFFQLYAAPSARRAFSLFLTGMMLLGVLAPVLIIIALPGAIFALYKKANQSVWCIS